MPQNDEKDPEAGADDAKVDRILSGMKGARMPDILKVQSPESKGEKFASYQSSHAVKPGEDTQKLQPAVVVDQTQQDGISAAEIALIKSERRERNRRDATTAVIELDRIPKKKNTVPLLVFLTFLALAAVGLIIKANRQSAADDDVIAPATAAVVTDTTLIPPPPTAVAPPTTTTITSAALPNEPNSAQISAQPLTSAAPRSSSNHASPSSSGNTDPDLLLFKPHRTP
jgi:hypothetical protein